MKPPGLRLGLSQTGLTMCVTRLTYTEDKIWDAVETAISSGWTVAQFKKEAATAWSESLKDIAKDADKEWRKP
jgi:hypothetical protein